VRVAGRELDDPGAGNAAPRVFSSPNFDPTQSWFSCCLRLDDLGGFYAALVEAGVPEMTQGVPRIQPPQQEPSGRAMGALVDPDGSLLRLIQN
jgi:hypothetical protein